MRIENFKIKNSNNPFPPLRMLEAAYHLTASKAEVNIAHKTKSKGGEMTKQFKLEKATHEEMVVQIAEKKDRSAFRALFDHFAPRLKSYLISLGLTGDRAEEIAQDVMVTLWQKAAQFNPEKAKVSTWIFRIARNRHIDLIRKQKYPEVNADDHTGNMVAPEKTDEPLEGAQTANLIKLAMSKLKNNQQDVIKLSFFEELSHSEIAERLDLPLGTVKSRIRTAFQTLRREIGEYR